MSFYDNQRTNQPRLSPFRRLYDPYYAAQLAPVLGNRFMTSGAGNASTRVRSGAFGQNSNDYGFMHQMFASRADVSRLNVLLGLFCGGCVVALVFIVKTFRWTRRLFVSESKDEIENCSSHNECTTVVLQPEQNRNLLRQRLRALFGRNSAVSVDPMQQSAHSNYEIDDNVQSVIDKISERKRTRELQQQAVPREPAQNSEPGSSRKQKDRQSNGLIENQRIDIQRMSKEQRQAAFLQLYRERKPKSNSQDASSDEYRNGLQHMVLRHLQKHMRADNSSGILGIDMRAEQEGPLREQSQQMPCHDETDTTSKADLLYEQIMQYLMR